MKTLLFCPLDRYDKLILSADGYKLKKYYLIDSENVGDSWISLLLSAAPEDEILVFYTLKSPHMSYKNLILLKQSPREVCFIECCEGANALDFQLCT
ncbi:MAG: PIN domain-containing protein, partial [Oscillospiraceae bacterium]|nr:PIN domain-containing protein [Oscillospiraceae bacterium]